VLRGPRQGGIGRQLARRASWPLRAAGRRAVEEWVGEGEWEAREPPGGSGAGGLHRAHYTRAPSPYPDCQGRGSCTRGRDIETLVTRQLAHGHPGMGGAWGALAGVLVPVWIYVYTSQFGRAGGLCQPKVRSRKLTEDAKTLKLYLLKNDFPMYIYISTGRWPMSLKGFTTEPYICILQLANSLRAGAGPRSLARRTCHVTMIFQTTKSHENRKCHSAFEKRGPLCMVFLSCTDHTHTKIVPRSNF
jgi:hypothetical protein